jgi:hypothetical protein
MSTRAAIRGRIAVVERIVFFEGELSGGGYAGSRRC